MNIHCIIQARISSSRLPAKVMLSVCDKPLLIHLVERIKKSKIINKVIVATSSESEDELIYHVCKKKKIDVFKGSLNNLLNRYYYCAKKFKSDIIVRITSDCPLMDVNLIDKMLSNYLEKPVDYLSNIHPPTYPDGFDVEIFPFKILKKIMRFSKKEYEKEHVTPYLWDNPHLFNLMNYSEFKNDELYKKYRLTLDFKEDFYVISKIYNSLYFKNNFFSLNDVVKFIKKNQHILVNKKLIKVNWYGKVYKKLRTISKKDTNLTAVKDVQ
jgi:spore coat polysaccharide biosynthesis protein SpsF